MPLEEITSLMLPFSVVQQSPGFSLDAGGSVVKVVYVHKDDFEKAEKNKADKVPIRLVSFPIHELDDAIKLLNDDCNILTKNGKPKVFVAGLGMYQYGEKVEVELGVSTELLSEGESVAKAFLYMVHHSPKAELIYQISNEAKSKSKEQTLQYLQGFAKVAEADTEGKDKTAFKLNQDYIRRTLEDLKMENEHQSECQDGNSRQPLAEDMDIFPCMMAVLGSAFGWIKLERDGSWFEMDMSAFGGRAFVGAGKALLGAKDFAELIALAEKGDSKNVDEYGSDLVKQDKTGPSEADEEGKTNVYDMLLKHDFLCFCYGKAARHNADRFKKEDLAACLLQNICMQTAHIMLYSALVYDLKHIYLLGSFPSNEVVRNEMYQQFHQVHCRMSTCGLEGKIKSLPKLGFVKGGSHFGALGAFLHTIEVKNGLK